MTKAVNSLYLIHVGWSRCHCFWSAVVNFNGKACQQLASLVNVFVNFSGFLKLSPIHFDMIEWVYYGVLSFEKAQNTMLPLYLASKPLPTATRTVESETKPQKHVAQLLTWCDLQTRSWHFAVWATEYLTASRSSCIAEDVTLFCLQFHDCTSYFRRSVSRNSQWHHQRIQWRDFCTW